MPTVTQLPPLLFETHRHVSVCRHVGWQTTGYTDTITHSKPNSRAYECHFGVDANTLVYASDGCSVPTYALPLDIMALIRKLGLSGFPMNSMRLLADFVTHKQLRLSWLPAQID